MHFRKERARMVYVLSKDGQPLMPTNRHGKVRHLLKDGQAKVVKRCPFTIQLTYDSTTYTQNITLGVDAGSKMIGISASTEEQELYSAEVELRRDIVKLLSTRRQNRRGRRSRKTRYRQPRFLNRKASKKKGWLAPSIRQRVESHIKVIQDIHKILPVTNIIVEVASFDIQKIKNPAIHGKEYQQGEQLDSWNVREYVLFRDGHTCQCCKGKTKDAILNTHHIESRKTGGDAPNNLITLCNTCHKGYHNGTIQLPKTIKRGMRFRDAAFMGIMRWAFYNRLKTMYPQVSLTYGYITKNTRIQHGLPKEHRIDALCIAKHPEATRTSEYFYQKKVRCHNRQIHKNTILKGNIRKRNQAEYFVKGFRLFDKVSYYHQECFIFGRRSSGSFDIRKLDGTKLNAGVSYKRLKFLEPRKTFLTERRLQGI